MSKSTYNHDRDGIAIDALRKVFPTYWLYKNPGNMFGGREYSEDLIIEIVNDDARRTVTGIEFCVQNKTDVVVRKQHVTVNLGVDDIKRLLGLPRPVLIHAHHIDSKISYWLWLNEWYVVHYGKVASKKKELAIKIPKKNVLDNRTVEKIKAYASWQCHRRKLQENAEMVARIHANDYSVHVLSDHVSITTIINPKHEGAIPLVEALDQLASDSMIRAKETGEPTPLVGSIAVSNLPKLVLDNIGETLESAWLIPIIPESQDTPIKIELLNETDSVVFKTPFVLMRLVRSGTLIKRWEGANAQQNVTYAITFDWSAKTTTYDINFDIPSYDLRELRSYFAVLDTIRTTNRLRITNLQTDTVALSNTNQFFNNELTPEETVYRRMIFALTTIEIALDITLPMPQSIDDKLLNKAEWVAEALRDGGVKINAEKIIPKDAVLICGDPAHMARKFLADFELHGKIDIRLPRTSASIVVELLNKPLELGPAHYAFSNVKILNVDELHSVLANEEISDDTSVKTVLDVDRDEVYLSFESWPLKTSDT